ncbi:hypothetical protein BJ973_007294 [Actinoplanes tereljensis]|uniref:DUF4173 domain-containing protein n=1 Tax=Paractinoplanes tereljensis TaxID=571912 RepID=A0A919NTP3_9ACTN|nr:DUF4173 domain-containing protein [Actinoplanes tereljensis]GIF25036.1 hypothetical protein Ate02nite_77660 [Actinoplanes tereljensis]
MPENPRSPEKRPADPTWFQAPTPAAAGPAKAGVLAAPPRTPPPPGWPRSAVQGPWQSISPWARQWPGAGRPAGAATLAAVVAAAVIAAISLPLDRAGVGWLVTAVAGTVALIVSTTVPARPLPNTPEPLVKRPGPRLRPDRYGWAAATVALLAVGTFRSAGWLFALCLVVATLTGALALAGGGSMRAIAAGYTMPSLAAFRSVRWLGGGAARLRGRAEAAANVRVAATIAVSVALLVVFGALFASADAAFSDAISHLAPAVSAPTVVRWIFVFVVAGLALGGAAFLRAAPPDLTSLDGTEGRKVARFEWAVPLGLLVLLFAGFVAVQLAVLFGGNRHVLETDGLTYAQYARGGFWQLSFVTGLTLVVLAGAARWAPREKPADRLLLRIVLGTLAGLTLIIVGSALHRMNLYADTYGLTRLRLLVACCEAWFGLVLLLVLGAGLRIRAPWLPRVAIAAGVLALLGLAAANPDRLIAEHNIRQDHNLDLVYLGELSPDAVPGLAGLDPARRGCVLGHLDLALRDSPDDWRGWNLGREQARKIIARDLSGSNWSCA